MSAEQNCVSNKNGNVQKNLQENGMPVAEDHANRDNINFDNLRSVRIRDLRVTNAVLEMDPIVKVLQNMNESINQLSNNVKNMHKEIRSMKETMSDFDKRLPVGSLEKFFYKEITNTFKAITNMTEQAIVSRHIDHKYISQRLENKKSNSEKPVNVKGSQEPVNDEYYQDSEISDQLNKSIVSMTQTTGNENTQEIENYNDPAVPHRDFDTSISNTPVYAGNEQVSVNDKDEENISLNSLQRKTMQTEDSVQSSRKRAYEEDDSAGTSSETTLEPSDRPYKTIKTFRIINTW